MTQTVLVTGGFGFLGRAVARIFKARGCRVVGIGHGAWAQEEARTHGFDVWRESDVSLVGLAALGERYDLVVHCAGAGSVGFSMTNPLEAFDKTVRGTAELLDHLRRSGSTAVLVYPSSAAIYGAADDEPLAETHAMNPVSPYGYHKKITEDLLECYSKYFGVRVAIVRFFSIYGPELTKQLLWDAAAKLSSGEKEATFWGTGDETRDWIHVDDAAALIARVADGDARFVVVNGATGERVTVARVLEMLRRAMNVDIALRFNGVIKPGDPRYYHADMTRALASGWRPSIALSDGLAGYVRWMRSTHAHSL